MRTARTCIRGSPRAAPPAANPRADWYVWADPKRDGTPPNNWQSVFGGPAWTWDARRGQYYMHTFLKEQPQLNVHNPAVQDALLDVARFWLERGVDGFRLDALNHSMHDPRLRNNPPAPDDGKPRSRPFDFQIKRHSQSQPGVVPFIERIRALCDEYGAIHTVAEVGGDKAQVEIAGLYARAQAAQQRLWLRFPLCARTDPGGGRRSAGGLGRRRQSSRLAKLGLRKPRRPARGLPLVRAADVDRFARVKMALLLALRGNVILYQGEELGLRQDHIPFEQLQDPEAIANWPLTLSRDGARTPMPWRSDAPLGGFTTGQPWLPLSAQNLALAVASQQAESESLLARNPAPARAAPQQRGPAQRADRKCGRQGSAADVRPGGGRPAPALLVQSVAGSVETTAGAGACRDTGLGRRRHAQAPCPAIPRSIWHFDNSAGGSKDRGD